VSRKQGIILLYYAAWLVAITAVVIMDPGKVSRIFDRGLILILIPTLPSVLLYYLLK